MFQEEELEEKASSIFPADTILGFSNSNWKERLSSVEKLLNVHSVLFFNIRLMVVSVFSFCIYISDGSFEEKFLLMMN